MIEKREAADPAAERIELATCPPRPDLYLRISVTGHRRPSQLDMARVREGMACALEVCAHTLEHVAATHGPYFSSRRRELVLLSALAEGADQAAVDVFRAMALPEGLVRRVETVVPFDVEGYAGTMSPQAAETMRAIVATADASFVLADATPDTEREKEPDEERWRDIRYALAGDILVRQADVLIAVWDGVPTSSAGGTSAVIAAALQEGVPVVWVHSHRGGAHLMSARSPFGDMLDPVLENGPSLAGSKGRSELEAALSGLFVPSFPERDEKDDIDWFARSRMSYDMLMVEALAEPVLSQTRASAYRLLLWLTGSDIALPKAETQGQGEGETHKIGRGWPRERRPTYRTACNHVQEKLNAAGMAPRPFARLRDKVGRPWAIFDALASRLGHHYRSAYVVTFFFAAAAVLASLASLFFHHRFEPFFVLFEFVMLSIAVLAYLHSYWRRVHDRWLLVRNLEEQFRPAWTLAQLGLGGRRVMKKPPVPWSAWALQAWVGGVGLPNLRADRGYLVELARCVLASVVQDQRGYHRGNAIRLDLLDRALEHIGRWAFYLSPVAGFLYLLRTMGFESAWEPSHAVIVTCSAGFPAIAAAMAGLRYQGDFLRFSARSARTRGELETIEKALDDFIAGMERPADRPDLPRSAFGELRDILLRLEAILIDDLEDWRYVYAARPNPGPG